MQYRKIVQRTRNNGFNCKAINLSLFFKFRMIHESSYYMCVLHIYTYTYVYVLKFILQKYLHVFIQVANTQAVHVFSLFIFPPLSLCLMLHHPRQYVTLTLVYTLYYKISAKVQRNTKCQKYVCFTFF